MPTYPVKRSGQIEAGQTFEVRFRPAMPGVIKVISQVTRRPGTHIGGWGSRREPSPDTDSVLRQKLELFKPGSPSPVASKTGDQGELLVWCDGEASAADLTGADWVVRITNLSDVRGSCDVTVRYPTRQGNLGKIDHIVVVMMENRSFDHMLGYLRLQGGRDDIDGLTGNESNTYNGTVYPVRPLTNTFFNADPDHGKGGVEEQLGLSPLNREDDPNEGDHSGFVKNFATVDKRRDPGHPSEELGAIMGYYTAPQVPTYDFLAREFTVCDRWFCSVPGATWPNRLYALSGSSAGTKDNDSDQANDDPPGFDLKTIFEFLQERGVEWTSYYSDFPFALIFKGIAQDATYTARIRPIHEFFQKAKTGDLPAVSWLDPNYEDVPESNWPNDDHPPIDILNGQAFVAKLYQALVSSPAWSKTLFVITYDEHG
jgi:phospholipase C